MNLKVLFVLILFLSGFSVSGQASWGFSLWFHLIDKDGIKISKEDFIKRDIKLLSLPFGAHKDNRLVYDTLNGSFKFSQNTITTGSILAFVEGKDTTKIAIGTKNLFIDEIILTGDSYEVYAWDNNKLFKCNMKFKGIKDTELCVNSYPFSTYKISKNIDVKGLVIVNLE